MRIGLKNLMRPRLRYTVTETKKPKQDQKNTARLIYCKLTLGGKYIFLKANE